MNRFLVRLVALAAVPAFVTPTLLAQDKPADKPAEAAPASQAAGAELPAQTAPTVLVPVKNWFAPGQPIEIKVNANEPVTLVLTEFTGTKIEAKESAEVTAAETKDVRKLFPAVDSPGAYLLYAVPKGKEVTNFLGTPLVIGARGDRRPGAPPGLNVVKVEPLRYVSMTTTKGPMTWAFYYDVAPNTTSNILSLAAHGFYSGLSFHRIVPGFVVQGGDPRGDGMGGPGYMIDAEFNERPHKEGVLSMARSMDPNSAGSQFFICLDYAQTAQLDRQYTAFGQVITGAETYKALAAVKVNADSGRPAEPQTMTKVEARYVSATENPYIELQKRLTAK